ncbi:MAG: acyl-CoA thioesterase [Candidatus Thermoplasmatota archaeon]|nr:acyl-CoA thioesterase [Candidatus Thermoplasmatota archaeon]MCL5793232.1 acyl-CoA thioesterase [Candidatus Thermoplasmatota archaeon]
MKASGNVSRISLQVRYRDLDSLGHVNNAVYLSYFEMGRINFFMDMELDFNPESVNFVLAHVSIDFRKSITLFDSIMQETWIQKTGRTSVTFRHRIVSSADGSEFCTGETIAVWLGPDGKKAELPEVFRKLSHEVS